MSWCDCTTYGPCEPCDAFRRREYSRSGLTPDINSMAAWSARGSGRDSSPPPHPLTTQQLEEAPVTPELGDIWAAAEGEAISDLEPDCA